MVELRSVPDCPNLAPVREALYTSLAALGLPATVTEVVGDYPSPSVLVNGVDVMGAAIDDGAACRLDLPTAQHLRAALQQAMTSPSTDHSTRSTTPPRTAETSADTPTTRPSPN